MSIFSFLIRGLVAEKEQGATVAEYALMISGIAVALVGATLFLGSRLSIAFDTMRSALF